MHFWKNACRGYMMVVGPFNACWSYLFSCEWCHSLCDALVAYLLFLALVIFTPFVYLCVAPFMAFLAGTKGE